MSPLLVCILKYPRFTGSANHLTDKGNTVLIIEHNLDVIKQVDYIIDIGPEGGKGGGKIIAEGTRRILTSRKVTPHDSWKEFEAYETYNKKDFKPKKRDAWSVFKIMGEFVNGYEQLSAVNPAFQFLVLLELQQIVHITPLALK